MYIFLKRSLLLFSLLGTIFGFCQFDVLAKSSGNQEKNIVCSGLTLPPASGKKPDSIVVLFHGYGDNGENFLFLGTLLGQFLPNTLFVAPDGPTACKTIPSGRQWLTASKDNRSELVKEIKKLTPPLNQYLDGLLKTYHIPPEKMAFLGFSQGARIALHIGLRRPKCAGIVAMSGSYLDDPSTKKLSQPPILLMHGEKDQKAPVSLARESYEKLNALKLPVTLLLLPGVDHDIDPQGLLIAGEFLQDCLSGSLLNRH